MSTLRWSAFSDLHPVIKRLKEMRTVEIDGKKYERMDKALADCALKSGWMLLREIKPEPMPEILPGYLVTSDPAFWLVVRAPAERESIPIWDGDYEVDWICPDLIIAVKDRGGNLIWQRNT